ncbi:hypothetical protein L4C39_09090 [Vibrio clamense]|uniref:tetratricopeptide repeat protein n=1 Tax=Vibrio TaxID=662 RepID=UPI00352F8523
MYRSIILSVLLVTLVGCSSTKSLDNHKTKESMLIKTNNYDQLVLLYKEQLKIKENKATRVKLADAYLNSGDAESALFIISPIALATDADVDVLLIQAHSEYELGSYDRALTTAERAHSISRNNADIENLLGVIYAGREDYVKAREYFNLARTHLYDDIKIKNNLAVLDIIEGQYKQAVQKLLPIYLNEDADDQLKANLTLAMAKLGNFEYVKSILGSKYDDVEVFEHFSALKGIERIKDSDVILQTQPISLGKENEKE